jgi:hypothetical protein
VGVTSNDGPPESNLPAGLPAGSYLVCGWLTEPPSYGVLATTETTFTVAPAQGSITVLGPASTVYASSQLAWKVNWSANAPSFIAAAVVARAAYVCPANPNDITKAEYNSGRYYALSVTSEQSPASTDVGPGSNVQAVSTTEIGMADQLIPFTGGTIVGEGPYVERRCRRPLRARHPPLHDHQVAGRFRMQEHLQGLDQAAQASYARR